MKNNLSEIKRNQLLAGIIKESDDISSILQENSDQGEEMVGILMNPNYKQFYVPGTFKRHDFGGGIYSNDYKFDLLIPKINPMNQTDLLPKSPESLEGRLYDKFGGASSYITKDGDKQSRMVHFHVDDAGENNLVHFIEMDYSK